MVIDALAFSGTNLFFRKLMDHGEKERKSHDLTLEKLRRIRDKWNKDRIKFIHFINIKLRETNETMAYINNVDEAMLNH